MKNLLFIGAAFIAASALARPASAKSYEFTFYSSSGSAYCDGMAFDFSQGVALGDHIYDGTNCPYKPVDIASANANHVKLARPGKWFFFTQTSNGGLPAPYLFAYLLDVEKLKWNLYYESSAYDIPLTLLGSGTLVAGPPPQHRGGKTLGASIQAGLTHIKR